MSEPERDQRKDGYAKARSSMRSFGPPILVLGAILVLVGFIDFIHTMYQGMTGGMGGPPTLFLVCGLPGMILLGIGMYLTSFGYMREVSQYAAKETAPAVGTTTAAVRTAWTDDGVPCPGCSAPNEPGDKYCASCGVVLTGAPCASCGSVLEVSDRFCSECGAQAAGA